MLFGESVTNIAMKTKELIKTSIAYDDVLKQLTNMSLIRNAIFLFNETPIFQIKIINDGFATADPDKNPGEADMPRSWRG